MLHDMLMQNWDDIYRKYSSTLFTLENALHEHTASNRGQYCDHLLKKKNRNNVE